jgi:hypothetical protein
MAFPFHPRPPSKPEGRGWNLTRFFSACQLATFAAADFHCKRSGGILLFREIRVVLYRFITPSSISGSRPIGGGFEAELNLSSRSEAKWTTRFSSSRSSHRVNSRQEPRTCQRRRWHPSPSQPPPCILYFLRVFRSFSPPAPRRPGMFRDLALDQSLSRAAAYPALSWRGRIDGQSIQE